VKVDPLSYYSRQGQISDPKEEAGCLDEIPEDISKLCDLVQGLVIHAFWVERYGVKVPGARYRELQLRGVAEKLKRIRALEDTPILHHRPPEKRLLGNCRDFSLLLCSMLRHQGVPARARCGFATYFLPNHFEDHWVCEYWRKPGRWVMVDAQLDPLQRGRLGIDFDTLDVPADRFIVGGKAWQMYRSGKWDPEAFGISNLHGAWFIRGNLVRDLASLNKIELLPWDAWGLIDKKEETISNADLSLLDKSAALSQGDNDRFADVRDLYLGSDLLRVPPVISSYRKSSRVKVNLAEQYSIE